MRASTLAILLLLGGCKACQKPPPEPVVEPPPPPPPPPVPEPEPVPEVIKNFERVNFAFDSTRLVGDSQEALRENAEILQNYPGLKVEVQGHADERGTTDYNLALGERRAKSIKDALTGMGVSSSQITTVSYGEERPLDTSSTETAWSKNRRAEFRVTSAPMKPGLTINGTVN